MSISLGVVLAVFVLIAVRQIGQVRLQFWHAMGLGALVVLLTGEISPEAAWRSIDMDVMLFLFGMFVIGQGLEDSGYLAHLSYKIFKRAASRDALVTIVVFGAGAASAVLMNDTLAIIGTPVVLLLARKHAMRPTILLLALAFGVTIGSVMSPIGNPQNLLIALHGDIPQPFLTFLRWLGLPTVINLGVAVLVLRWFYADDFHDARLAHSQEPIRDHTLAVLSRISLQTVLVLIAAKILFGVAGGREGFSLTHIALGASLPILVGSKRRWDLLRRIDWPTLAFFVAMFIVMESVWQTGFFQGLLVRLPGDSSSPEMILLVSVVLSQVISNVPLVALLQPALLHAGAGTPELMALAAGSTIAGNLLILGAASNVIIIQNAERRKHAGIRFLEFARIGFPLTIANLTVYWFFLRFL